MARDCKIQKRAKRCAERSLQERERDKKKKKTKKPGLTTEQLEKLTKKPDPTPRYHDYF